MSASGPHVVMVPYAGFGQGDVANCIWLSRALRAQGARVTLLATGAGAKLARGHGETVLEDPELAGVEAADRRAPPLGSEQIEAFLLLRPTRREPHPSYQAQAHRHVQALRRQFVALGADLVVAKYRWPALLAAESLGLLRVAVLHAPHHPHHASPAAAMREPSLPAHFHDPYPALDVVNAERGHYGLTRLHRLNDCHAADLHVVMGPADPALALGSHRTLLALSASRQSGQQGALQAPARRRIYAYLGPARIGRGRADGLRDVVSTLLQALAEMRDVDALLVDPTAPGWDAAMRLPGNVRVVPECLDAPAEIRMASLVVHSGGSFTGLAALDLAIPTLTLPYSGENHVRADQVSRRKLGGTLLRSNDLPQLLDVTGGEGDPWLLLGHKRFTRTPDEMGLALRSALGLERPHILAAREELRRTHVDADGIARGMLALRAGRSS